MAQIRVSLVANKTLAMVNPSWMKPIAECPACEHAQLSDWRTYELHRRDQPTSTLPRLLIRRVILGKKAFRVDKTDLKLI